MKKIFFRYFIVFFSIIFFGTIGTFIIVEYIDPHGENEWSIKLDQRLIPLLPVRLDMDPRVTTVSAGKPVRWEKNHGLAGISLAEAGVQHHGLPEQTG